VSHKRLLALVSDLTAEQWGFHPAAGRWSIADCLEHVTRVENRILGIIQTKTQDLPQQVAPEIREKDDFLMKVVPERTDRRQAPEIARPIGQWTDARALLAEFEKARAATSKLAAETTADLRAYIHPHGVFGDLDCYQWLLLLGLHSERHARQIEEVKADPAFPSVAKSAPSA
jgi:uncharacterized damage-inducible protein DinB